MEATVVVKMNKLPGMDARLRQADRDIRMKGALDIHAASLPYTPVDTGLLRGNVEATEDGVHWRQEYAAHQEFGTVRGVTPKLFARTGFEQTMPSIMAAYQHLERQLV